MLRIRGVNAVPLLATLVVLALTAVASAADRLLIVNPTEFKWTPWAPGCDYAMFRGDPEKEASHRIIRAGKGCAFPKHWHVNGENVAVISGSLVLAIAPGQAWGRGTSSMS